jgi:hypothetical protein
MRRTIQKLMKLRAAIEAQAELTLELIDAALLDLDAMIASVACPGCGEEREEKIEDTTPMGNPERRLTCLNCGASWYVRALAEAKEG